MRGWVRDHGGWFFGVLAFVATVVPAVGWAVPSLRDWLLDHPGWGWTAALVALVSAALVWKVSDSRVAELEKQVASATNRVADLEAPVPTTRDRKQFEDLLELWSWSSGTLAWLDQRFNGKRWKSDDAVLISLFPVQWAENYFDDPTVDEAFREFRKAVHELSMWMATHTFPDRPQVEYQVLPGGDEREDGWPEFDHVRAEGEQLGHAILVQRRTLERVGRSRGL